MNSFRKTSSPNVSTTIFTILVSFWFDSLRIRHLGLFHLGISHLGMFRLGISHLDMFRLGICHFWNSSDISLKNLSQIALYRYNNSVVIRAGVWGLQEFCKLGYQPSKICIVLAHFNRFAPLTRQFAPF